MIYLFLSPIAILFVLVGIRILKNRYKEDESPLHPIHTFPADLPKEISNYESVMLSRNRMATLDTDNSILRTYDFDGENWVQAGNDLNIST